MGDLKLCGGYGLGYEGVSVGSDFWSIRKTASEISK
jgi:hypothetical protein